MTVEEIEEKKTRVTNRAKEVAEDIQCVATRDLLQDIWEDSDLENVVDGLEGAIADIEGYIESLRRYKEELSDLVDCEYQLGIRD